MAAWFGPVVELIKEVFVWGTSESGWAEVKKKREGRRLQEAADKAFLMWKNVQTEDSWKKYQIAKAALERHSNSP